MDSLKKQYTALIAEKIGISADDFTETEETIIFESFSIIEQKLEEIKTLTDEVKRLNIELLNLRAMYDEN